jgi:Zn-dependent protease with chaperone function
MTEVKGQVIQTIATLLTTAFGLIAALAWNEAIKAIITTFIPKGSDLTGLLIYAILITIIAVVVTLLIARAIPVPEEVQLVKIVE